jgi:hypothetical protein
MAIIIYTAVPLWICLTNLIDGFYSKQVSGKVNLLSWNTHLKGQWLMKAKGIEI